MPGNLPTATPGARRRESGHAARAFLQKSFYFIIMCQRWRV
ncbi:hypothetical protein SXCC_01524 [Gluconacetobacter sp. SXCC-1]|nr:hypothetical protein SXCC_01524 [Gluconacetobacter sp. SXCC-1]